MHHFASNVIKTYTSQFKKITDKYQLDLDSAWNKELLPHQGRHPNKYHDFILDGMNQAARKAKSDKEKFLELFESYVKEPVRLNPDLLRRIGWE